MNRNQALEWLVENVTKWPVACTEKAPMAWAWTVRKCEIYLICLEANYKAISHQHWLDATDNMEKKEDE